MLRWIAALFGLRTHPQSAELALLTNETSEGMRQYQQGDVLPRLTHMAVETESGPTILEAPHGVVIISQTCDLIRDDRPLVHVAKRAQLTSSAKALASSGKMPRYIALPAIGDNEFADLDHLYSLHKNLLASQERIASVRDATESAKFGQGVGRYFSRFAFPNEIHEFFSPLARHIHSKAGSHESPEGRLINRVVQLRLQSLSGWETPPYDLQLIVIVDSTALPMIPDDELPEFDEELHSWLYDAEQKVKRTGHDIASRLEATTDANQRFWLWKAIGDAWTKRCKPSQAVPGITTEVMSADEFTFTMLELSQLLDLDYLSSPTSDRTGPVP